MKKQRIRYLLVLIWIALFPLKAQGKEDTLENLKFGEYWFGKEVALTDLEGKVVLFEMWGT
ncbi:MAG: hypothetical protein AABZ60_03745 [Planctomycetota bacterium]